MIFSVSELGELGRVARPTWGWMHMNAKQTRANARGFAYGAFALVAMLVLVLGFTPSVALADGTHEHDGESFQAWTSDNSLPTNGSYYLDTDVTLDTLQALEGGTLNLCLNGHTITCTSAGSDFCRIEVRYDSSLDLYDCSDDRTGTIRAETEGTIANGVNVEEGTLTMRGGNITGFKTGVRVTGRSTFVMEDGTISNNIGGNGGVFLSLPSEEYPCSFTMKGGVITENQALGIEDDGSYGLNGYGGGVYCQSYGSVTIQSGLITNNYARRTGGGIFIDPEASFTLYGDVIIEGNTQGLDEGRHYPSDIVLGMTKEADDQSTVTLAEALIPNLPMNVGIYARESETSHVFQTPASGTFTADYKSRMGTAEPAAYFTSIDPDFAVAWTADGKEACLADVYDVSVDQGIDHGTVTVSESQAPEGATVTVTATPDAGYALATLSVTGDDRTAIAVNGDTFTMPAQAVTVSATFEKAYTCVSGDGSTWISGSANGLSLTFERFDEQTKDTTFEHFTGVSVDGKVLGTSDYDAVKGSVVVTLKPSYLESLKVGTHTIAATFDDGEASASFSVAPSVHTKYTVTVTCAGSTGGSGEASADPASGPTGTVVTLSATPDEGSEFVKWELVSGTGATLNGNKATIGTSDVKVQAIFKAKAKEPIAPTMSNSRGGKFTSTSEEIAYTISQKVPDWATSLRTWVDLEDVLAFTTDAADVTVTTGDGAVVGRDKAGVSIDGQRLTVTVADAMSLRGDTLQITYKAKLRDGVKLDAYLNADKNVASVPYQAHTVFDNDESLTASSEVEYVKFRVSSSSSSSSSGTSTKSATLAKTGDPSSVACALTMGLAGAAALVAGRKGKRD